MTADKDRAPRDLVERFLNVYLSNLNLMIEPEENDSQRSLSAQIFNDGVVVRQFCVNLGKNFTGVAVTNHSESLEHGWKEDARINVYLSVPKRRISNVSGAFAFDLRVSNDSTVGDGNGVLDFGSDEDPATSRLYGLDAQFACYFPGNSIAIEASGEMVLVCRSLAASAWTDERAGLLARRVFARFVVAKGEDRKVQTIPELNATLQKFRETLTLATQGGDPGVEKMRGEPIMQAFLEEHEEVFLPSKLEGSRVKLSNAKGTQFEIDFVLREAPYERTLLEIESPQKLAIKGINNNKVARADLSGGLGQVESWLDYFEDRTVERRPISAIPNNCELTGHLIIGRRTQMDRGDLRALKGRSDIRIETWDHLYDRFANFVKSLR